MLDSGTTKSLCGNENSVTNIQMAKNLIEVKTSAGTTVIDKMSNVPGFGEGDDKGRKNNLQFRSR